MAKVTIIIAPSNGLAIPGFGHMKHGKHKGMEVTPEQLAELKEAEGLTVKEAGGKKASSSTGAVKPADEAELSTAIRDAIAKLDVNDQALWTQAEGVPTVEAVEGVLGYNISAAERNAALK